MLLVGYYNPLSKYKILFQFNLTSRCTEWPKAKQFNAFLIECIRFLLNLQFTKERIWFANTSGFSNIPMCATCFRICTCGNLQYSAWLSIEFTGIPESASPVRNKTGISNFFKTE